MSSAVPRLNLGFVGASTITTPNIPGMRYNGYVKTARGAGRVCVFDTRYGFPTEGAAQTSRTARSNAVSFLPSFLSALLSTRFFFLCPVFHVPRTVLLLLPSLFFFFFFSFFSFFFFFFFSERNDERKRAPSSKKCKHAR